MSNITPDLSLQILYKLFKFDPKEVNDADITMINLNSVFSTTFYDEMIEEFMDDEYVMENYVESVGEIFKKALTSFNNRVMLVYSTEVSNLTEIYDGWREERYNDKQKNDFAQVIFDHFIDVFIQLDEVNPTIGVVNTKEFDPAFFPWSFNRIREFDNEMFIISRDMLDYLNLELENVTMFDGKCMLDKEGFKEHEFKDKLPHIEIEFLKYWYRIYGVRKYDYPGVRGYGEIRTEKFLNEHLNDLINGDTEYNDSEMRIFSFDHYIDSLDKEKYKKLLEIVNSSKF